MAIEPSDNVLPGPGVLRVLICDELPVVRDGLRALLADEPDIAVTGTAADGEQALASARAQHPDVMITGLALRGLTVAGLIQRLSQGAGGTPAPKVVVFAMRDDPDVIAGLLRANVNGLLVNDTSQAELAAAVRAAARGHTMVSPSITRQLVDWFREFGGEPAGPTEEMKAAGALLTPKEREVLGLIAEGMSPEAVAGELVISVATVRTHVYRARTKLEARDRAQLVAMAHQVGLVRHRGGQAQLGYAS